MTQNHNNNPFNKSFSKGVKTQNKKPNKFQLTSKKEYQIIKQDIYITKYPCLSFDNQILKKIFYNVCRKV